MKKLLTHQIIDARRLLKHRISGNFSGMGTGKTLTAIEAYRIFASEHGNMPRLLVIGPPISLDMWMQELQAETPWLGVVHLKTGKTPLSAIPDAVVVTYDIATRRAAELREWIAGGMLICDESHALKSALSKRAKCILGKDGIASKVTHGLMLTGTPMTRYADDLYTFLARADLPNVRRHCGGRADLDAFQRRFTYREKKQFHPNQRPKWVSVRSRDLPFLREWLYGGEHPLAIRRELAEVASKMPAITRQTLKLDISKQLNPELKKQLSMYRTQREIEKGIQTQDANLSQLMRQLGEAKVTGTVEYIAGLVEDDAVEGGILLGCWHVDVAATIRKGLEARGIKTSIILGATSQAQRVAAQDAFNGGSIKVLVGQIASMGVSLNLQHGGHTVITAEEAWSPAMMDQFYARLYRMGQKYPVQVINLRSNTETENLLIKVVHRKMSEAERLNQPM